MVSATGPDGAEDEPLDSVYPPDVPPLVADQVGAALLLGVLVVLPPTEPLHAPRTIAAAMPAAV